MKKENPLFPPYKVGLERNFLNDIPIFLPSNGVLLTQKKSVILSPSTVLRTGLVEGYGIIKDKC